MKLLPLFLILALPACANAASKENEAHYRDAWAKKHDGKTEVTLPDGTKADIITKTHAIEVEWAHKWYEGFGLAL